VSNLLYLTIVLIAVFSLVFLFLILNIFFEMIGIPKKNKSIFSMNNTNNMPEAKRLFIKNINSAKKYFYMVTGGSKDFFNEIRVPLIEAAKEGKIKIIIITEKMNSVLDEIKNNGSVEVYLANFKPKYHFRVIDDSYVKIETNHSDNKLDGKIYSEFENSRFLAGFFLNEFRKYLFLCSFGKVA